MLSRREPPGADPHAGWCGEGGLKALPYPIRWHSGIVRAPDYCIPQSVLRGTSTFPLTDSGNLVNAASINAGITTPIAPHLPVELRRICHFRSWVVLSTMSTDMDRV